MRIRLIILLLLSSITLWANHSREVSREFVVGAQPTLDIELSQGEMEFVTGPEGVVTVRVVQSLSHENDAQANQAFDDWKFDFSQKGDSVVFRGANRHNLVWDWNPVRAMQCTVTITLPRSSGVAIKGRQLRVSLDRIDGDLSVRMDAGSLFAKRVGGDVSVKTLDGQLTFSSIGGRADLNLQTGQILIGRTEGPLEVNSNGGVLEVQQVTDTVKVSGETLDVILGLANPLKGKVNVSSALGSIVLKVENTANVTIDAAAPWLGAVKTRGLELEILSGRIGSSRLNATLNGGGPLVTLRARGGTVSIIGMEPLGTVSLLDR